MPRGEDDEVHKDMWGHWGEKIVFNDNKKQLLCSNNLSLEMKSKLIQSCIWSFAVCGSETGTVGRNEERIINVFGILHWRGMLKIKWIDRLTNGEVFQKRKKKITLVFKFSPCCKCNLFLFG